MTSAIVNIAPSTLDVKRLVQAGEAQLTAKHATEEAKAAGNLRGGNSGALVLNSDGSYDIFGTCHRKSLIRLLGIEVDDKDDSSYLMFAYGHQNEDNWRRRLTESWQGKMLAEEEIPIAWDIQLDKPLLLPHWDEATSSVVWSERSTVKVTGRPDRVLLNPDGTLALGLEMKGIASKYTAKNVVNHKPDSKHLVQAAHYMLKLGIPFNLVYSSYVKWHIFWRDTKEQNEFDGKGVPLDLNDKGRPKAVQPFEYVYRLSYENGRLCYQGEDNLIVETAITADSIEAYYRFVLQSLANKDLGVRPSDAHVSGEDSYSQCGYCALSPICDKHENDFDRWLDEVKLASTKH